MLGIAATGSELSPDLSDAAWAWCAFLMAPTTLFCTFIGREWGRLRWQRHLDRLEAEAMAAEGFPPPDPPATDQPPA